MAKTKTWSAKVSPDCRHVPVPVSIQGHQDRSFTTAFVLDPGTEVTIIDRSLAYRLDLTEDRSIGRSRLIGPTGPDIGYRVPAPGFTVFGRDLTDHVLHCHRLWSNAGVTGLVGLDIIRRGELVLNLAW
jgi:hypothetical protein